MIPNPRKIGGDNNKRGNRYEDLFAVYRMIQFAPTAIQDVMVVRLKEQVGCPVDDLLLVDPEASRYHQLKADKSITWGEADRKMEKEFLAHRFGSISEHQHIVRAFHTAWVNHEPDAERFCVLGSIITKIYEWGIGRLRHDWKERTKAWQEAEKILESIAGLRWWVDRGYFEWEYLPTDRGLSHEPCESQSFDRFLHRLIEQKPSCFADFERLLA